MQGKRLDRQTLIIAGFVFAILVVGVLIFGDDIGLYGTAGDEDETPVADADGDGVPDDADDCPDQAGPAAYNGCPPPDSDGDGVPDDADECPDVAGPINGCPDGDGDGIKDSADDCPGVPGPASNNGCPVDSDGDGITDDVDECPNEAGPAAYNGCPPPDSDGDGITDDVDECPNEAGTAEYNGCPPPPDADGDGIPDDADECPGAPGPAANNGCPADSDGDGIADADDECPNEAGTAEYNGCPPPPDADGDGIPDDADECPNEAGPVDNNGCPLPPPDADGDGVPDADDQCPDTPQGATVDANGCEIALPDVDTVTPPDADGDGVPDADDQCPDTPQGVTVDEVGCEIPPEPADADGDGVPDADDQCPDTPEGVTVDANGCAVVQPASVVTVQVSYEAQIDGFTVSFTDTSAVIEGDAQITGWSWDFGDGNTSTDQNPTHTYAATGTYNVTLTVTLDTGETHEATGQVEITEPQPVDEMTCGFETELIGDTLPYTVNFINTSTNAASYLWDFGGGDTTTEVNPSRVYDEVGTYTITLTCTNAAGDLTLQADGSVEITEGETQVLLVAQFSASPASGPVPLPVSFSDESQGDIVSWSWTFGDGNTSTDQNPSHTYQSVGVYDVTLTVTDTNGQTSTATGAIEVIEQPEAPVADFTVTPQSGESPLTVTVTDASSGATSWTWNFGDGSAVVTGQGPHTHTYENTSNQAVTYNITLTIEGPGGGAQATKQVVVLVPGGVVDANFEYEYVGTFAAGQQEVCFTDTSIGNIASWEWTFGDGNSSTDQSPCHTYTALGQYGVTLKITGMGGETSTASKLIPIFQGDEAPVAKFSVNKTSATTGSLIRFYDESEGVISAWLWDFGNGDTSTDRNPTYVYQAAGTYSVKLTVTGPGGSSEAAEVLITIEEGDDALQLDCNFSGYTSLLEGQSARYWGNVSNVMDRTLTYSWYLEGTLKGEEDVVDIFYDVAGTYTLTFNVVADDGAECTVEKTIRVRSAQAVWPNFSRTPRNVAVGGQVCFSDRSEGSPVAWRWEILQNGEIISTSGDDFCHTFNYDVGRYHVRMYVTGADGQEYYATRDVYVREAQSLSADAEPEAGVAPLSVTFTATSSGLYEDKFEWTFPDGSHAYTKVATYTFTQAGTYEVIVTGRGPLGSMQASVTVAVSSGTDIRAAFTPQPWGDIAPVEICFTDRSVSQASQIVQWVWNFGDGSQPVVNTTGDVVCHTYTDVGSYLVTLEVTSQAGLTASASNTVHAYSVAEGRSSFTIELKPGREVCFTSLLDEGLSVTGWDFGNGQTSTDQNPCIIYNADGDYNVTMSYAGDEFQGSVTKTITVKSIGSSELPTIYTSSTCLADGVAQFTIGNSGGDMLNPAEYRITDADGNMVDSGNFQLTQGEEVTITATSNGVELTLSVPGEDLSESIVCQPLLSCQRNNPERIDCSSLMVTGQCDANTNEAVFIITNTGDAGEGDMIQPTEWRLLNDETGEVLDSGNVQLAGGASMELRFPWGGGKMRLEADQQIGHPGSSVPQADLDCEFEQPPDLALGGQCIDDQGTVVFTVTNNGGAMDAGEAYSIYTAAGEITSGTTNALGEGESQQFTVNAQPGGAAITFEIAALEKSVAVEECFPLADLSLGGQCIDDQGTVVFTITNNGGPMQQGEAYSIYTADGELQSGTTDALGAGASQQFTVQAQPGGAAITFEIAALEKSVAVEECFPLADLSLGGQCIDDQGTVVFTVTNNGGPMQQGEAFSIYTADGELQSGTTDALGAGASQQFTVQAQPGGAAITFEIAELQKSVSVEECFPLPDVSLGGQCVDDQGTVVFTVTNNGGPMPQGEAYSIFTAAGVIQSGSLQLGAGESMELTVQAQPDGDTITFEMAGLEKSVAVEECFPLADLALGGQCVDDQGTVVFTVTNNGGPMQQGEAYSISSPAGEITSGTTNALNSGESQQFTVNAQPGGAAITFEIAELEKSVSVEECFALSELALGGECVDDQGTVVFTVTNNGGPMQQGEAYSIMFANGLSSTGTTDALDAGASQQFTVNAQPDGGTITFSLDQLEQSVDVDECFALSDLALGGQCVDDQGTVVFTVTNNGGPMQAPEAYSISDADGVLDSGTFVLVGPGESMDFTVQARPDGGTITFAIPGMEQSADVSECFALPELEIGGQCVDDQGTVVFTVTNTGGPMQQGVNYTITFADGLSSISTTNALGTGESQQFTVQAQPDGGKITFAIPDMEQSVAVEECFAQPDLALGGECLPLEGVVTFTLTNNGGPMQQGEAYTITTNGTELDSGTTDALGFGASQQFTVDAPADGSPVVFESAGLEKTATVTECFARPGPSAGGKCIPAEGVVVFTLANTGGPMPATPYTITSNGVELDSGTTNALNNGESQEFTVPAPIDGSPVVFEATGPEVTATASVEDCFALPELEIGGQCVDDEGTVVFTVTNNGGPMRAEEAFSISDADGVIQSGTFVLVGPGESMDFTVQARPDGGTITFAIPGMEQSADVSECFALSELEIGGQCVDDEGTVVFTVTNNGGPMQQGEPYRIFSADGDLDSGTTDALGFGESMDFTVQALPDGGTITFAIPGMEQSADVSECFALPELEIGGQCVDDEGTVVFTVTNNGGPMRAEEAFSISDADGVIQSGTFVLVGPGESMDFTVQARPDGGTITFAIPGMEQSADVSECFALPDLDIGGQCVDDEGTVVFTVTNNGGPMQQGEAYRIFSADGELDSGTTDALGYGVSQQFTVQALPTGEAITFEMAALEQSVDVEECFALPDLDIGGQCVDDEGTVVFTVTNNGGPMQAGESYRIFSASQDFEVGITDALGYGASQQFTVQALPTGEAITFEMAALEQSVSVEECFALPDLKIGGQCIDDQGAVAFTVTNDGGPMQQGEPYRIYSADSELDSGTTDALGYGESQAFRVKALRNGQTITFEMAALEQSVDVEECFALPELAYDARCVADAVGEFTITNNGGPMRKAQAYEIVDANGAVRAAGNFLLDVGETEVITIGAANAELSFAAPSGIPTVLTSCDEPEPTPTPTPTATEPPQEPPCGPTGLVDGFPSVDMNMAYCGPDTPQGRPWEPIEIGAAVCPDWLVYHTDQTGDWEIFRLGKVPGAVDADPNISQGVGPRAYDVAPSRSPDAQWVAFASYRDGNWEIYIGKADGTEQRRVTTTVNAIDIDPVWSPTGDYIAYESSRSGDGWDLYMVDIATGEEIRLTDAPSDDINPFWSPDGSKIVFQTNRDGMWQIYELNVATQEVTRLSDGLGDDHDPQYSFDGSQIAFRSYRGSDNSVIYVMNSDGSDARPISDPEGDAINQVWSPDDNLIAYQSNLDGDEDIYVYEFPQDGDEAITRLLTDNTINDYAPTWYCDSPEALVFTSDISEIPEDSNIFMASALPITADPIDVAADATQMTFIPDQDQYPQDAPAEENASREEALPGPARYLR